MSKNKNAHNKLYKAWKQYLSTSRLSHTLQIKRAKEFTRKGMQVPGDIAEH